MLPLTTTSSSSGTIRQWLPGLAAVLIASYPLLCRALRNRHLERLHAKYPFSLDTTPSSSPPSKSATSSSSSSPSSTPSPHQRPLSSMTEDEAHDILLGLSDWEFPLLYELGLEFALVRTYGIPSISHLLLRTQQLSTAQNVSKRYSDTVALVAEMYSNAPSSPRSREAFGRLNFLHGQYIRAGRISNDDMLYVLALFMSQPVEHIDRLDWRRVSVLERCATGVFHKSMGDALEIDMSNLPPSKMEGGWRDGLQFYEELDAWAKEYEARCMVPHEENYAVTIHSLNLLMAAYPPFVRGFVYDMAIAAMDDRFRESVILPAPGRFYLRLFGFAFATKRVLCRHLLLPRVKPYRYFARTVEEGDVDPRTGRRHLAKWQTEPMYVKPTLWNRWGPGAWAAWLIGQPLPGDEGMVPEGFLLKNVGPENFVGKGWDEMEKTVKRLEGSRTGGCPFA